MDLSAEERAAVTALRRHRVRRTTYAAGIEERIGTSVRALRFRDELLPSLLAPALLILLLPALLAVHPREASAQVDHDRHVLLIGGLGGEPAYQDRFASYLAETRASFENRFGIPAANVTVLAEESVADRPFVSDVSTAENIRSAFDRLADDLSPDDHLYVILFGHGSFDGTHARLNIPRRDLDDADYAALLDEISAGRIIVINTSSASGPFASALSAPDRILISATATGTQRDETVFPQFFVEALKSDAADLDKSGGISVLEAFRFAAEEVARSFEAAGQLATEHAVLDDDGDGEPTRFDRLDDGTDGALAGVTFIRPAAALANISEADRPLLRERETLHREIADLKNRKAAMSEDAYYAALEEVMLRLARLNERLDARR